MGFDGIAMTPVVRTYHATVERSASTGSRHRHVERGSLHSARLSGRRPRLARRGGFLRRPRAGCGRPRGGCPASPPTPPTRRYMGFRFAASGAAFLAATAFPIDGRPGTAFSFRLGNAALLIAGFDVFGLALLF